MTESEKALAVLLSTRAGSDLELTRAAVEYTRELLCAKLGYRHSDLGLDEILTAISDELR